jgi:hypothetical protein
MAEAKIRDAKILRSELLIMTFLAVLLPTVAWANYGPPPVASTAPKALILLIPLVILFTELGGGYQIFKIRESKYFDWWEKVKPLLALFGICLPVFLSSTQAIGWILLGFIVFCGIRSLQLIGFGIFKLIARSKPQWSKEVRAGRLIPAGLMIFATTYLLVIASNDAVIAGHHGRRAYDSDAKANLHNIYLACKAYWADSGSSNACNVDIFTLTTYGYIQSADVVVSEGGGHEQNFSIMAKSKHSKKAFEINTLGEITRKENTTGENWEGNPIEAPSIFSRAYNLLVKFLKE